MTPPITALGSRYGIQGALGKSVKRASTASTWWDLDGTITSCIAAYQPKGAASYAASKVNLANPGTYDAFAGIDPDWDLRGWVAKTNSYLKTGIVPSVGWSLIVSVEAVVAQNQCPIGSRKSATDSAFYVMISESGANTTYGHQGIYNPSGNYYSGVFCVAGQSAYRDGAYLDTIPAATNTQWYEIYLMGRNTAGSMAWPLAVGGVLKSAAIYNATLTAQNVADLNAAMAAL